jgi:hypothetical protein
MDDLPVDPNDNIVTVPSAPTGGALVYTSASDVTISWEPPGDYGGAPITTYRLTLVPTGETPVIHLLTASTQYYQLDSIVDGTDIQATVEASNDEGATYGPEFVFPIISYIHAPTAPPVAPEAIANTPGIATISWNPPETVPNGSPYYMVLSSSSNPNDPVRVYKTEDMTQVLCTLLTLNPESEYYFTVQVVNPAGESPTAITNTIVF